MGVGPATPCIQERLFSIVLSHLHCGEQDMWAEFGLQTHRSPHRRSSAEEGKAWFLLSKHVSEDLLSDE